jgi:hypothetical protein
MKRTLFQYTWYMNGFQLKIPEVLQIALQSGDYVAKSELILNRKVLVEAMFYFGVINI